MEKSIKYLEEIIDLAQKIENEEQEQRRKKGLTPVSGDPPVLFHLRNLKKLIESEYVKTV